MGYLYSDLVNFSENRPIQIVKSSEKVLFCKARNITKLSYTHLSLLTS